MDKLIINGNNLLNGQIKISGSKNAVLPIMAATILNPGKFIINNVPDLRDTRTMAQLLREIGAIVKFNNNTLHIDSKLCSTPIAPYELVKTMRASFYVLGPLLGRFNKAVVSLPGGCAWGPRPVDIHLKAFEKMDAKVELDHGNIITTGPLNGSEINFRFPSVGATGNVLMAAIKAKGRTIIRNVALEPEIISLGKFLIKMGANINGLGTETIEVNGVKSLSDGFEFDVIPDRIEAGTFLIAGALCGNEVEILNSNPSHLENVISKLKECGSKIIINRDKIKIIGKNSIKAVDITTKPYPGFPTDLQAQWLALMCKANGSAKITEGIYLDRFTHVAELKRLGANIKLDNNVALVKGVNSLKGAPVMSTDIRASASLILASLAAIGKSEISRIYHIDRGYEKIEEKFKFLGADIARKI